MSKVYVALLIVGLTVGQAWGQSNSDIDDLTWQKAVDANIQNMDQNQSMRQDIRRKINVILGNADINQNYKIAGIQTDFARAGCGTKNMWAELQAMADGQAMEQGLESLLGGVVSEAPLLLTCYYSPTICSYIKHIRNMINAGVNIRTAQCRSLENYVDQRAKEGTAERWQACMDEKGGGLDAAEECRQSIDSNPLYGLPINAAGEYRVAENTLKSVLEANGLSETEAQDKASFLSSTFGDVVYKDSSKTAQTVNTRSNVQRIYSDYYKSLKEKADNIISEAKSNNGMPSQSSLEGLVSPWAYIHEDEVAAVYNWLGEDAAKAMLYRQAEIVSRLYVESQLHELEGLYQEAKQTGKTAGDREKLQTIINQLKDVSQEYGGSEMSLREESRKMVERFVKEARARAAYKQRTAMEAYQKDLYQPSPDAGLLTD